MVSKLQSTIKIPEDVTCKIENSTIEINGKLGTIKRDFSHSRLYFVIENDTIIIRTFFPKKKQKAVLGTIASHVENMIFGVTLGFKYLLKIVYSHFPIKIIEMKEKQEIKIENLYGGQAPKIVKIVGNETRIKVEGENIELTGIDKEAVGQTSANLQEATRLHGKRRKSPKTFMDGLYVFDKSGTIEEVKDGNYQA